MCAFMDERTYGIIHSSGFVFFVEEEVGAAVNGDENGGGCRHGEDRDLVSHTSRSALVCIKPAVLSHGEFE